MTTRQKHFSLWAWTLLFAALLLSAALVPVFGYANRSVGLSNGLVFAQAFISLSSIPFFVVARRRFSRELHGVYAMLGTGIGLLGLSQLQTPIIVLANWMFLIDSGLITLPFLISTLLIYLSMRQFVKVLGVRSRLTLPWLVIAIATIGAVAVACVPLVIPGTVYDGIAPELGFAAWNGIFALLSAGLVGRAAWRVSSIYSVALGRLNTALSLLALSTLHYVVVGLFLSLDSSYVTHGALSIPFVATGILFLWAGVAFNLIGEADLPNGSKGRPVTSLTIITYTASLASDQDAIGSILDGARAVSAPLVPDAPLTPEAQRQLAQVYRELETYLTTKEGLQVYTRTSLRQQVTKALRLDKWGAETFWPLIQD